MSPVRKPLKESKSVKYTKGYRFRFNHFLNIRKTTWEEEKKSVAYSETSTLLTQLKADAEHLWLKEADSIALQQSLRDLDVAYQDFFKHDRGYPKFKSKRHHRLNYRTTGKSIYHLCLKHLSICLKYYLTPRKPNRSKSLCGN